MKDKSSVQLSCCVQKRFGISEQMKDATEDVEKVLQLDAENEGLSLKGKIEAAKGNAEETCKLF